MPLPTPKKGESKKDFVARFMANATARKEFPEAKQRYAVALQKWTSKSKKDG